MMVIPKCRKLAFINWMKAKLEIMELRINADFHAANIANVLPSQELVLQNWELSKYDHKGHKVLSLYLKMGFAWDGAGDRPKIEDLTKRFFKAFEKLGPSHPTSRVSLNMEFGSSGCIKFPNPVF